MGFTGGKLTFPQVGNRLQETGLNKCISFTFPAKSLAKMHIRRRFQVVSERNFAIARIALYPMLNSCFRFPKNGVRKHGKTRLQPGPFRGKMGFAKTRGNIGPFTVPRSAAKAVLEHLWSILEPTPMKPSKSHFRKHAFSRG